MIQTQKWFKLKQIRKSIWIQSIKMLNYLGQSQRKEKREGKKRKEERNQKEEAEEAIGSIELKDAPTDAIVDFS